MDAPGDQPVVGGEAPGEPARGGNRHVDDPAAGVAPEVLVGLEVRVVAGGSTGGEHLDDLALGDEDLEIPVDGAQGELRELRGQRRVDLRRRRVEIGRAQPGEDARALLRAVAPARRDGRFGGIERHGRKDRPDRRGAVHRFENFS